MEAERGHGAFFNGNQLCTLLDMLLESPRGVVVYPNEALDVVFYSQDGPMQCTIQIEFFRHRKEGIHVTGRIIKAPVGVGLERRPLEIVCYSDNFPLVAFFFTVDREGGGGGTGPMSENRN